MSSRLNNTKTTNAAIQVTLPGSCLLTQPKRGGIGNGQRNTTLAGVSPWAAMNDGPRSTPWLRGLHRQKKPMPHILPLDVHTAPGCWNTADGKRSASLFASRKSRSGRSPAPASLPSPCLILQAYMLSCSAVSDSCNTTDCSPPGSSIHGISQARILEWVAITYSSESSQPRNWTCVSCIAGGFFTTVPPGKPSSLHRLVCIQVDLATLLQVRLGTLFCSLASAEQEDVEWRPWAEVHLISHCLLFEADWPSIIPFRLLTDLIPAIILSLSSVFNSLSSHCLQPAYPNNLKTPSLSKPSFNPAFLFLILSHLPFTISFPLEFLWVTFPLLHLLLRRLGNPWQSSYQIHPCTRTAFAEITSYLLGDELGRHYSPWFPWPLRVI